LKNIKRIDINEFCKKGFLQEANRIFFHPLGLALVVERKDNGTAILKEVLDYRDDPEGVFFSDTASDDFKEKVDSVTKLRCGKMAERVKKYGSTIQPIGVTYKE
jgi:hypothetical protein